MEYLNDFVVRNLGTKEILKWLSDIERNLGDLALMKADLINTLKERGEIDE